MELTVDQALQQGVAAHKEGKLQVAERLYHAILQAKPKHPDANHNLGVLAVAAGKPLEAIPLFKLALEANPKIEQFWLSYIDALIEAARFDEAQRVLAEGEKSGVSAEKLDAFNQQLQISLPNDPNKAKKSQTLSEKRKQLAEKKKSKREKKIAQSAPSSTAPSQDQAHQLLEYYQAGKFEEARALATSLTQQFPKHPFGWKLLGAVLKQTGRLGESLAPMQLAVKLSLQDADVHYNLGNTLLELGRLDDAETSYSQAIALKPELAEAHSNLGNTLKNLGRLDEAEASYKNAIALKSDYVEAHNNLGNTLQKMGRLNESEASYKKAIALKSDYAEAHNNLGNTLEKLGRLDEAEVSYKNAIALKLDFAEANYNLGNTLQKLGKLDRAEASYKNAINLKFDYAKAHNNLGNTLQKLDRPDEAEASYKQAIALNPDFSEAYWNLQGTQKTIQRAERCIDKCLEVDETEVKAQLMKAAFRFYQGDKSDFNNFMQSELKQHAFMRSFAWVFGLPNLPELHFNKFCFFDAVVENSIISRPFYEFGVWRAASFNYLIKTFKKGYGFDTFTGLPEDWDVGDHLEKTGAYTSDGTVPKIKGGEFIVGKFEDTLPVFFSEHRPMASVINFDADLYSSTICALTYSKTVMDKDTILIFDEFIINESWEQDEFRALNEFCSTNSYGYEVMAVSFFTKQVAVKLTGI